jgi:hypothetical protein
LVGLAALSRQYVRPFVDPVPRIPGILSSRRKGCCAYLIKNKQKGCEGWGFELEISERADDLSDKGRIFVMFLCSWQYSSASLIPTARAKDWAFVRSRSVCAFECDVVAMSGVDACPGDFGAASVWGGAAVVSAIT